MYNDITTVQLSVQEEKAINNSIKNILLTMRGSVPGKPRFGSDLYKLVFSQLDHVTESIAKIMIQEALKEFEDRIVVQEVEIVSVPEYNRLQCNINYRYKDSLGNINNTTAVISLNQ